MTEIDFPRGEYSTKDKTKATPRENGANARAKNAPANGGEAGRKTYPKKGAQPTLTRGKKKDDAFASVWSQRVTGEHLTEGVLGVGCVVEVNQTDVVLETPNSWRVCLPVTEVGTLCLSQIKEGKLSLEEAFPLGHFVSFKVLSAGKKKNDKTPAQTKKRFTTTDKLIRVTSDPAKVNGHLVPSSFPLGASLAGQIKSIEEKGLLLDLGLKGVAAFVPFESIPDSFSSRPGRQLIIRVTSTVNSRLLTAAVAVEMDTLSQDAVSSLKIRSLTPGTVLLATPLHSDERGVYVDLGNGVHGFLSRRALPPRLRADPSSFKRPLRVIVLLCQQTSNLLVLSAHPDIVAVSRADKRATLEGVSIGDLVECKVSSARRTQVEFSLADDENGKPNPLVAVANSSQLENEENIENVYKVGTTHKVRVLKANVMDRTLVVSTKKDVLKQEMVSYSDAEPGVLVTATIKQLLPVGVKMTLYDKIPAFIPVHLMADKAIPNLQKHFPVGESIRCRVVKSDEDRHSIVLTSRKSQVNAKGLRIVEVTEDLIGKLAVGIVVHRNQKGGVLVEFYNNITGLLPHAEVKKRPELNIHDAIEVRVMGVNKERGYMRLAFPESDGKPPSTRRAPEPKVDEFLGKEKIQKFCIYKGRVEGEWPAAKAGQEERGKIAAMVKLPSGYGRLHACELPQRFLLEGRRPIEDFLAEFRHKTVQVVVIGSKTELQKEGKRYPVFELSMRESKLAAVKKTKNTMDYGDKFTPNEEVRVFYAGKKNSKGNDSHVIHVFEVSPRVRALLPPETAVTASDEKPSIGEQRTAKVVSINAQENELIIAFVTGTRLQVGETTSGRVQSVQNAPLKARVLLSNGDTGLLTPSGSSNDYSLAIPTFCTKAQRGALLDVQLVHYHEPLKMWMLTLPERVKAAAKKAVDPIISSSSELRLGMSIRGFVQAIKKKEKDVLAVVELSPGVTSFVSLPTNEVVTKHNDVVRVKIVEREGGEGGLAAKFVAVERPFIPGEESVNRKRKRNESCSVATEDSGSSTKRVKKDKAAAKFEMTDPGFDWEAAEFSVDALAEISGLSGKKRKKEDVEGGKEVKEESEEKESVKETTEKKEKAEPKAKKIKKEMTTEERIVKQERMLSAKEKRQMAAVDSDELTTVAEFTRALKGDPNSAELWIRYMSHLLTKGDLSAARATAERALETISYREDAELAAIWAAYINLEVSFGDSETAQEVFTRSCQAADSFKMHKHMAATLSANGNNEEANAIHEAMLKKFRVQSDEVWTLYAEHLMGSGRAEDARKLLTRALDSVPKSRHVQLISRFAQMEFVKGDPEKGRNMFESLVSTYPKKTDVWTVFIDLTVKHSEVDQARQLLERVCELPMSVFKLRPFFKKWADFEKAHGDEKSQEEVRKRAERFVSEVASAAEESQP